MTFENAKGWLDLIQNYGFPFVAGCLVLYFVFRMVKWVPGVVKELVAISKEFIAVLLTSVKTNTEMNARLAVTQEKTTEMLTTMSGVMEKHTDPSGKGHENHVFSTHHTNKALALHADALQSLADAQGHGSVVKPHVDAIKRELKIKSELGS